METVLNIEVSILEGCPYRDQGSTSVGEDKGKSICDLFTPSNKKCLLTEGILCGFYAVMSKKCTKKCAACADFLFCVGVV